VFTSPTPDQIAAAAQAVEGGRGVLLIVKNYSGDVMNFEMAAEVLSRPSATVLVQDDVAVESSTYSTSRRGVAGTLVVEKIVGAAAEAGADLASCAALGERVARACGSMGVALTSCTVPAAGNPPSPWARAKWSWASASTASPAAAASRRGRRRRSRTSWSAPSCMTWRRGGASRCCSS